MNNRQEIEGENIPLSVEDLRKIKKILSEKIFEDFEVAALDLPDRYNIDGLIGMNLLNQFNWCMHPQKSVISIHHDPFIGG